MTEDHGVRGSTPRYPIFLESDKIYILLKINKIMIDTCPFTDIGFKIISNPAHITPRTLEEETGKGYKPISNEDMLKAMDFMYTHCRKEMNEALLRIPEYDGTGQ